MKYVFMAGIFAFTLCTASFCYAEEMQKTEKPALETQAAKEDESGKLKHIDLGDVNEGSQATESGVNQPGMTPPGETYDENTGLPNDVESDKRGEVE